MSHALLTALDDLVEKVKVLHNTADWDATIADLTALRGDPNVSDGASWAEYDGLAVADETALPPWCLMAKTTNLDLLALRAGDLGWHVGPRTVGAHEERARLDSPTGVTVIGYCSVVVPQ